MMKKPVFSLIIFLLLATTLIGQSKVDSLKRLEKPLSFSKFFDPYSYIDDTSFFNELNNLKINSEFSNDTSSIWLITRMQLSRMINQESFDGSLQSNILNPLNQQYNATQRMKLFKSILGAVQIGAVGYLAYQHLKKYGFLKKR